MNGAFDGIISVALAIVGIAIVAVLVSRNSNTSGVITAASKGLATAIGAAVSPVTGGAAGFGAGTYF